MSNTLEEKTGTRNTNLPTNVMPSSRASTAQTSVGKPTIANFKNTTKTTVKNMELLSHKPIKPKVLLQKKNRLVLVISGLKHFKKHKNIRNNIRVMNRFQMRSCLLVLIGETLITMISQEALEIKQLVALVIPLLLRKLWNQDLELNMGMRLQLCRLNI